MGARFGVAGSGRRVFLSVCIAWDDHRVRGFGCRGFADESSGDVAVENRVVGEDLTDA